MIRLVWRQFRLEAAVGLAALLFVAIVLSVTGPHLMTVFRASPGQLAATDPGLQVLVQTLLLLTPALVGLFFGAPLIAREIETGTYRLAWTQGVTRRRWLVVKFVLVGLSGSLLAGGLSLMVAWWANPIDITNANRFTPSNFGILGVVPFAYGMFAFALGATTGLLFRKTLPAMATTLVGYVTARLAVTYWIRPRFEAPARLSEAFTGPNVGLIANVGANGIPTNLRIVAYPPTIPNAWPLSAEIVNNAGQAPTSAFLSKACPQMTAPIQGVGRIAGGSHAHAGPAGALDSCVAQVAAKFHEVVTYQPASRYWSFQIYETALFVVLALGLAGCSLWWVHRRLK